jgi:hypothetical protein
MIHHAFFLALSSVAVTNHITLPNIMKKSIHTTKYRINFMKGNMIFWYKLSANLIQLGVSDSFIGTNSSLIIPFSQTKDEAKKPADTIIIIHTIQNITNLIHSFILSSLSDVIILYHPINATAIHITINISII